MGKLEELIKQEQQLKHRIQLEKNKLNAVARKRRDGKLISWGIVIETMLNDYSGLENLPGGIAPGFGIEEDKRSRIHEQEKSELYA